MGETLSLSQPTRCQYEEKLGIGCVGLKQNEERGVKEGGFVKDSYCRLEHVSLSNDAERLGFEFSIPQV